MKNSIRGNAYKILHSKILWLHLLAPVLAILVFAAYYSYSGWSQENKAFAYIQVIAMTFPLMAAIVITMLYEMDLKAGGFANLMMVPYSRITVHLGNLLPVLFLGLCASVCAIGGFGIVFRMMGFCGIALWNYFRISVIMFGANIAVYVIQYIICYEWGKGVSLSVGIIGTLLSPLLYLGLGDIIWRYIPCSYGIRLSAYFWKGAAGMKTDSAGVLTSGAVTILTVAVFFIWSRLWQSAGTAEE